MERCGKTWEVICRLCDSVSDPPFESAYSKRTFKRYSNIYLVNTSASPHTEERIITDNMQLIQLNTIINKLNQNKSYTSHVKPYKLRNGISETDVTNLLQMLANRLEKY